MLGFVRNRLRYIYIAVIMMASGAISILSPMVPTAYADTATAVDFSNKNLSFTRLNRTVITVGDTSSGIAYFYSSDPTGNNYIYNSVGLTCPATLTYAPMQTYAGGEGASATVPSSWTIEWTSPYESQTGCQTVKSSVNRSDDPKNNGVNERFWTVFYLDGDKINSVLKDNKTTFTKYKTAVMPSGTPQQYAYIEDGVKAVDCPSVIRYSEYDKKWAYIPMAKASTGNNASDQYKTLMNQALGAPANDVQCTPVDKDDLGLLKRFGLPENYYDRGTINTNNIQTNFGFSGNNLYGAELLGGIPGPEAAGIAANGPNANGTGIGTGKGVVDEAAAGATATTTCGVDGIGWIVCPVMNFMAGLNDTMYTFLAKYFLEVKPTIFTGSTANSGLYAAWNTFRGIANILFIVAFLIIVYSQVTSIGITNYGVKKLLPKLIVAAILVNVSYYLCQVAVDISNILGWGIKSLFTAIGGGDSAVAATLGNDPWGTVIAGALAVAGGIGIFLALSVPTILAGLLALLMIVVILIARQAIIILLIAISPVAFVAWLLPNTEKWFKKWWDTFFAMLMLFPIIGALYGAGALAASILGKGDFGDDGGAAKIAALGASILPLIAVIPILQGSLKATGALGAKISGLSGKANARIGSKVKTDSRLGRGVTGAMANRAQNRAIRQTKAGAKWYNKAWMAPLGGKGYGQSLTNKAASLENEEFEKGIKAAESNLANKTFGDIEAMAHNKSASEVDRTAAIRHIMAKGNFAQRQALVQTSAGMTERQRSAVSDGVIARGDHSIYGAKIADAIKSGKVSGEDDVKKFVAQNISAGKVKPEAMVHDADATKLIADVTTGGGTFSLEKKDIAGNVVLDADGKAVMEDRQLNANEVQSVKDAATNATKLPATASKVSDNFAQQFKRL